MRLLWIPLCVLLLPWPLPAWAHAFPERSQPRVGSTVNASPPQVRIWFDADIEPLFSTLYVKNAQGRQVSTGKGHLASNSARLLETHVPALPPGVYHVYWSVVARDGHRTEGRYRFIVR